MDNKLYYIWNKSEKQQLSKNFSTEEFKCKCKLASCIEQRISKELIDKLQKLREEIGIPLIVTSGYRCNAHNSNIGGAKASQHLLGNAADIANKDLLKLLEDCTKHFDYIGNGVPKGFIHVDTRKSPTKVIWSY